MTTQIKVVGFNNVTGSKQYSETKLLVLGPSIYRQTTKLLQRSQIERSLL